MSMKYVARVLPSEVSTCKTVRDLYDLSGSISFLFKRHQLNMCQLNFLAQLMAVAH